jgi:hypothetical protein
MKTAINKITIVLFLVLLTISSSFAQMREPKQIPLKYNSIDTVTFHSSDNIFKATNQFVIGFHWNNEANAATAILANSNNIFQLELFNGSTPVKRKIQKRALLFIQDVYQDVNGDWHYRTFSHAVA